MKNYGDMKLRNGSNEIDQFECGTPDLTNF